MDLKQNKITVGEILKNEKAAQYLKASLPEIFNSNLVKFAKNMPLYKVLDYANKYIGKEKTEKMLSEIEKF